MSGAQRGERRRLLRELRRRGCSCTPVITRDEHLDVDGAVGGWVRHEVGCPLGDAAALGWEAGIVFSVIVPAEKSPGCR